MKKLMFLTLFVWASVLSAMACHFEFTTEGGEKKSCKAGEEFVLTVKLVLTHRNCTVAASQTKFKTDGIQVLGAKDWVQVSPTTFTRQIKVKVLDDGKKKVSLLATRTCDRDGGNGLFTLDK